MTMNVNQLPDRMRTQGSFVTRRKRLADDWQRLADGCHGIYRVCGARSDGMTFDPYWRTSTGGLVGDTGRSLVEKQLVARPFREIRNQSFSNLVYALQVQVYGHDVGMAFHLENTGATVLSSGSFGIAPSAHEWATGTLTFDPVGQIAPDGLVRFVFDAVEPQDTEARIWQIQFHEYILATDTPIPRTLF